MIPEYKLLPAGDTALIVEFADRIDRSVSAQVISLAHAFAQCPLAGVVETVPTFRSLMVHYDPLVVSAATLGARIAELMRALPAAQQLGRSWCLPACYDRSFAPDLDAVAAHTGLAAADIAERHSSVSYHVYMLGFLPGQAYMGDVPIELAMPRHPSPRPKIPAGSLAIAGAMTCIFPLETPCGWHIIGRSPVPLWQDLPSPHALLAPGDKVTFRPVSLQEYEALAAMAAKGRLIIAPSERDIGAAA